MKPTESAKPLYFITITVLKIINSFDLKSAIDRAWLGLQSALIAQLFENSLSAFVCSAFRSYPFRAPFLKKIPQSPGQKFDKYAILGDDVVICGIEIAKIYKQTLAELGVDISMSKSLILHSGYAEFAKRFWLKGTGRDAIGAIGTALVIIGRYASFSISGGLSLLLLVSASGYAFASTGAYGSLAGSNPKTNRFDRPGLGWWIE
ncbi:hypothetical protein V6N13_034866 [Hibiscus sabdariffa]